MVIISAVICDKAGSILVSRQFQNISLNELKEQVRNFPKLINPNQQHTFIDQDQLRYIYTPVDNVYILLMTNKQSNIIEDLEVLRILKQVINEICNSINADNVKKQSFEILLAIDDIISAGLRESVTVAQIQTALEMESTEEKLHQLLQKSRENEAKELAKKHQQEMERKRQEELAKKNSKPKVDAFTLPQTDSSDPIPQVQKVEQPVEQFTSTKQVLKQNSAPKKGMQLGKRQQ
ncbi:hypothetical protein pb186bvf_014626 [Paramecium bursaria]